PGETPAPQIPRHQDPPRDIKQVAAGLMREAIDQVGVPVSLMRKDHKLRVVDELRRRGFFLLKDSIEATANRLKVSRFTVYNYLNELEERGDADTDDSGKSA
ncbi:transcriptional regulator, partial [Xanthomonas citri pv. citri]|nr:transcriptional regulator [Xanthomonas citri pv. citri]